MTEAMNKDKRRDEKFERSNEVLKTRKLHTKRRMNEAMNEAMSEANK